MINLSTEFDASVTATDDVVRIVATNIDKGLDNKQVSERRAEFGPNELAATKQQKQWKRFVAQFADPLVYLLLAAIVVSLVAWSLEGFDETPFEAITIAVIVVANAVLGYLQERKASNAVAALQKMAAPTALVIRDGEEVTIPATQVVVGDILILSEGDAVSADGRLVEAKTLRVAEASLTGESVPADKTIETLPSPVALADRTNMVFSGTGVTQGRGKAIVTATGMRSQMGQIASLLTDTKSSRTPLQREIDRVGHVLGVSDIVIAVIVVAAIYATSDLKTGSDYVDVLLVGVSLAVAAVPEGLATILTVVLALGVQRMARRNAIVKNLSSVETLGSASVICSDKTGTLTKNEMTITQVVTHAGTTHISGTGYEPTGDFRTVDQSELDESTSAEVLVAIRGGSLANDASLHEAESAWTIQGDPTEAAFLVAERKLGGTTARTDRFERVDEVPFTSERKLMSSIDKDAQRDGNASVSTKGAPDILLSRCAHERAGTRDIPLTTERRSQILGSVDHLAGQALRTLGVAYKRLEKHHRPHGDEAIEKDLVFAGIVGMLDPARTEAATAIAEAQSAGMRILMITGDHPRTAERIAQDLQIIPTESATKSVLTGLEIDRLDDDAFAQQVRDTSVYARVSPANKLRIVNALQADGNVVAMTGDGVNDAPALKTSDIGVAMGITGTAVTKQSAKMIITDDNFSTIVSAVREGRQIFVNIRKFLRYLLSSNIGEVLTMFLGVMGASLLGLNVGEAIVAPLLATQILWINLLTDSAPALALGVDPSSENVMKNKPRKSSERLIDREMLFDIFFVGLVMAIITLLTIDAYLPNGLIDGSSSVEHARTVGFTVLVLAQLFNCFNARSEHRTAFHGMFTNRYLWGAIALSVALQICAVHIPALNSAFSTTPLSAQEWLACAVTASVVLWANELRKLARKMINAQNAI